MMRYKSRKAKVRGSNGLWSDPRRQDTDNYSQTSLHGHIHIQTDTSVIMDTQLCHFCFHILKRFDCICSVNNGEFWKL